MDYANMNYKVSFKEGDGQLRYGEGRFIEEGQNIGMLLYP